MARTLVKEIKDNKNYLINGDFDFWQRGTSFTTSGDVAYKADRWRSNQANSITHSRESLGAPTNSSFYYRLTFGTNSYTHLAQYLESSNAIALAGKTVTFSVLLRKSSSYVGTVTLLVQKNSTPNTAAGGTWSNVGSSLIANASIPTRVPSSTDWVRFSVTVNVPSDGTAAGLSFGLITNVASQTNGAILEVSQVMVNEGSVAAPFKLFGGDYVGELAACQRYYLLLGNTKHTGWLRDSDDTFATDGNSFPTTMRVGPVATTGPTSGYVVHAPNELSAFPSSVNCIVMTSNHYYFSGVVTNALAGAVRVIEFSGGPTTFDAEL